MLDKVRNGYDTDRGLLGLVPPATHSGEPFRRLTFASRVFISKLAFESR